MILQRHAHQKIGLLGGSFNPPHAGHREISLLALDWLGLDAVWWLVSPGNPLKDPAASAPYERRLSEARKVARHPAIVVSNFEQRRHLRYTVDTLAALGDLWPQMRFVWLMGADNLATINQWKDWRRIFLLAPVAVFNRPGFEAAGEESAAAKEFAAFRIDKSRGRALAEMEPPAWAYFSGVDNPLSSTALRARRALKN
ncbi:MAG TPA: nicotinate-nucleotide adenylyltransferase [Parvularculaceae bacterium]|nr:nicotinate-nucleotide adenylyltransferase [Parvularculaceae bacterium]